LIKEKTATGMTEPFENKKVLCQQKVVKKHTCSMKYLKLGGRVGLVVRAFAFHQCGSSSISALDVICGTSLLVLYSAMRGFPPGTPVFPSHQLKTNV